MSNIKNSSDDEMAQKQCNTELDRFEKAVEVAGFIGRARNPDQMLKPPTIVRSKRQKCWPVELFDREKKETLDP